MIDSAKLANFRFCHLLSFFLDKGGWVASRRSMLSTTRLISERSSKLLTENAPKKGLEMLGIEGKKQPIERARGCGMLFFRVQ